MSDTTEPRYTQRGFRIYAEIVDSRGSRVRVQESSAARDDFVWLFCENNDPSYAVAEVPASPHLTVEQARIIRNGLDEFINEHSEEVSAR